MAAAEEIATAFLTVIFEYTHLIDHLFSIRRSPQLLKAYGLDLTVVDARLKILQKIRSLIVAVLYKYLRNRATNQAKCDFYEAKLDPEWSYASKYASQKSSYLSPIQEEDEEVDY